MGTFRAQNPLPPQLLFLILLSCPWIQGKDMGVWGWAPGRPPLGSSTLFFPNILGLLSCWGRGGAELKGKGQAKAFQIVPGAPTSQY